jgi:hypothetical protein
MNINKHGAVQCGAPKNKNHTNKQTNKQKMVLRKTISNTKIMGLFHHFM